MVVVKEVGAKAIFDSRRGKTIQINIKTKLGLFKASAPTGKSTGKHESKLYKKTLEQDISTIKKFSDYFSEENIDKFEDLRRVEDILEGHVGGNTCIALEYAVLKALAKEQKKQVWQLINPKSNKFPRIISNVIGGGAHTLISGSAKKPDFQEFHLIPNTKSVKEAFDINTKAKKQIGILLKEKDKNFKNKKNDENAWITNLNEKEVFDLLKSLEISNINFGTDVAASSFYKRKKYNYQNPKLDRSSEEQLFYISNLIKNYNLFYIEDCFEEEDFKSFSELLKKYPNKLITGDDLTVTNPKRLEKAIKEKSINAIIIKPNQVGSLVKMKEVCELAKKNNIKTVFSRRSGETTENILADLAFGFQADFFKVGIDGKEGSAKIKRLIGIEKSLK